MKELNIELFEKKKNLLKNNLNLNNTFNKENTRASIKAKRILKKEIRSLKTSKNNV